MLRAERQRRIFSFLGKNNAATVAELSQLFGVSESTIRRDLQELDAQAVITRTHGGAVISERAAPEPPIVQRMAENAAEKKRIGQAAAQLVGDGETVFLGSGTTTLEVARNLTDKKRLTVITNALNIANLLAGQENITLVMTGGLLRHSELSTIGHITEHVLQELHADKVIMGIRAINVSEGLTNDYLPETMTDRAIIDSAPEVILVADHSKFGKVSTAFVAPVTSINKIVTDAAAPVDMVKELMESGIEMILV